MLNSFQKTTGRSRERSASLFIINVEQSVALGYCFFTALKSFVWDIVVGMFDRNGKLKWVNYFHTSVISFNMIIENKIHIVYYNKRIND